MAVRGRSWSVGSSFLRRELGSFECEEELARRLLMVSEEPDRELDARPSWKNDFESGRLSGAGFYSSPRSIWIRAFRCSCAGSLSGGCSGVDILKERFYGRRSKRGATKK